MAQDADLEKAGQELEQGAVSVFTKFAIAMIAALLIVALLIIILGT